MVSIIFNASIMFMSLGRHIVQFLDLEVETQFQYSTRRVSTCNASPKDESWILDPEVENCDWMLGLPGPPLTTCLACATSDLLCFI